MARPKALIFDMNGVLLIDGKVNNALLKEIERVRALGIKTIIFSNFSRDAAEFYRSQFPAMFSLFDAQYFYGETGRAKPGHDAFQQILSEQHLKPQEARFYDDHAPFTREAESLGIPSVHVKRGEALTKLDIE